jgi:hypothetical protein
MTVIQYRFKAFREAFGRDPQPNEPLFFAANCPYPRMAEHDQVMAQMKQAANATGVPFSPLMKFLELD